MTRSLTHHRNRLPRTAWGFATDVEQLFNHVFGSDEGTLSDAHIAPETNIVESETAFEVSVELPGIDPEDVKVELHDGQLSITGEKKSESEETDKTFHRVERRFGKFQRLLSIPSAVDNDKIDATYKNGVLTVTLPKSEKVLPKQIEVKSNE